MNHPTSFSIASVKSWHKVNRWLIYLAGSALQLDAGIIAVIVHLEIRILKINE